MVASGPELRRPGCGVIACKSALQLQLQLQVVRATPAITTAGTVQTAETSLAMLGKEVTLS